MAKNPRQTPTQVAFPKRGEIFLVSFDPSLGHEIQKMRPAVVIQNDISNRYSPITIVAAISSSFSDPPHPREVIVEPGKSGLAKRSAVILNQIRSVDRQRLVKKLGYLDSTTLKRVDEALKISLGLIEI